MVTATLPAKHHLPSLEVGGSVVLVSFVIAFARRVRRVGTLLGRNMRFSRTWHGAIGAGSDGLLREFAVLGSIDAVAISCLRLLFCISRAYILQVLCVIWLTIS